jgi:hypothetical protein
VRLSPAVVHTAEQDEAVLKADYAIDPGMLDLAISTGSMKVASLRAQAALAAVPWLEQMSSGEWSGQLQYHLEPDQAGWSGNLEIADATVSVPGLADPLQIESAHARIDGARVVLDHLEAQAGPIAFDGEYRYEPGAARPHRIRLRAGEVRAEDLESELLPILRRNPGLLARALGRTGLPDWLRRLNLEGSVQIEDLQLGGAHLENLRAALLWDATHARLQGIEARFNRAALSGALAVNLRGAAPAYQFRGKLIGLNWQSGKLDASGTFQTSGTGLRLLANLKSEGTFSGSGLDFGTLAPWHAASGSYALAWTQTTPRLRLTDLRLQTEDETYTGRGATQEDGRLLILLTNGLREMRMSGGLASLKIDDSARP